MLILPCALDMRAVHDQDRGRRRAEGHPVSEGFRNREADVGACRMACPSVDTDSVISTSRVCGVELPSIDAADLVQTVATRADEVYRALEQQQASGSAPRQIDVVVSFKEEKTRRTWYSTVSE